MIEPRRGDVIVATDRGDYTGKLKPMVIVQRDATLTTTMAATEPMRVPIPQG